MDSQRFLSRAFCRHVIQVIASYMEAFHGKFENKTYTFRKGHAIQEIEIPPRDYEFFRSQNTETTLLVQHCYYLCITITSVW